MLIEPNEQTTQPKKPPFLPNIERKWHISFSSSEFWFRSLIDPNYFSYFTSIDLFKCFHTFEKTFKQKNATLWFWSLENTFFLTTKIGINLIFFFIFKCWFWFWKEFFFFWLSFFIFANRNFPKQNQFFFLLKMSFQFISFYT